MFNKENRLIKHVTYYLYAMIIVLLIIIIYFEPWKIYYLVIILPILAVLILLSVHRYRYKIISFLEEEYFGDVDRERWRRIRHKASILATILLPILLIITYIPIPLQIIPYILLPVLVAYLVSGLALIIANLYLLPKKFNLIMITIMVAVAILIFIMMGYR